jgi:hypothetical protein
LILISLSAALPEVLKKEFSTADNSPQTIAGRFELQAFFYPVSSKMEDTHMIQSSMGEVQDIR